MQAKSLSDFSWPFLERLSWWSLGIANVLSAASLLVTRDVSFALACMLAAALDLAFIRAIASSARREIDEGRPAAEASLMFTARLLSKAGLLVLAALLPATLDFAGTVVGVLCFDLTLAVVGSVIAGTRLMRSSRIGR